MINFDFIPNIQKISANLGQNVPGISSDAFEKVLDSANKSFDVTRKILDKHIDNNFKNSEVYFLNPVNKVQEEDTQFVENEQDVLSNKPITEDSEQDFSDDTATPQQEDEKLNVSNDITTEQVLLDYKSMISEIKIDVLESELDIEGEMASDIPDEKLVVQNLQPSKYSISKHSGKGDIAPDKLVIRTKAVVDADLNINTSDAEEVNQSANMLPSALKSLINQNSMNSNDIKDMLNVVDKGDALLSTEVNVKEVLAKNADNSLASALDDVDADAPMIVTKIEFDTDAETSARNYDFNSSSFNNLSSHITKLALNKSTDFSKTMNDKLLQENQILNQVNEATKSAVSKGTTKVSIILRPENLGRVNVNIASNNGVLTAQFVAQNQQAAEALNKNLDLLKQNLTDQGVKVSDITVKVQAAVQAENFSDNMNFNDSKLNDAKENNSNKGLNKNKMANSSEEKNSDFMTEEQNIEEEHTSILKSRNNDLEIYNNMGRKL